MGHGIHATTTGPLGAGLPARDSSVTSKPSGSALSAALSQVVASIDEDARALARRLLELEPTFRALRFLEFAGFVRPEIREAFAAAFREAGVPE